MEPDEYARIAAAEDDHWWYRNTRALMKKMLGPWLGSDQMILDAGCGPGANGGWLAAHGHVVSVDRAPEALDFVRVQKPSLLPARASIDALPFPDGCFDVAVEVTVAYSVPDDAAAVHELARVLRPGGALFMFEPAFPALRRAHDTMVHGLRRYRLAGLVSLAEGAGLRVERSTYACSFLAPPALGLALVDRVRHRPAVEIASDLEKRWLDGVFTPFAEVERRWLTRHRIPFGTSVLVVASRPL